MSKKLMVGVLFGGRSAEHEVSVESAKNIISAIDKEKYTVQPMYITPAGKWYVLPFQGENFKIQMTNDKVLEHNGQEFSLSIFDKHGSALTPPAGDSNVAQYVQQLDVVFPILHGTFGEDGTMQGFLKLVGLPFVGPDVLGSAAAMDKDISKRLMRDAGLPIARFLVATKTRPVTFLQAKKQLGVPVFIKPANLGSSVGIHKAKNKKEYDDGIADALRYDNKVLIEEFIDARELDVAVLGNENPIGTVPSEIITKREFYDFDAKYTDDDTIIDIPAKISDEIAKRAIELSVAAFVAHACEGMARVELFLKKDGELVVSEVNTIPGFTSHSIYPRLWEVSGMSQTELTDTLIQLALDRHARDSKLSTVRNG